ncbi:MAG: ABC transporter permease [Clostridiales bacterium]|nr:ABC transporter permease [Clostridiales bacterium]
MLKATLHENKRRLILLLIFSAVILYAWLQVNAVDSHFQFAYRAPDLVEQKQDTQDETQPAALLNTALKDVRLTADEVTKMLDGSCKNGSLYAIGQPAVVSVEDGESVSARLVGIEQTYLALKDILLYTGRLIYPDEFKMGTRVALVDEQLAVALFKYAEPVGEEIMIADQAYTIIGIVRNKKQVGDEMEYSFYVPYRALEKSAMPLTELIYEAEPIKGAGGWAAFQNGIQSFGAAGTTISLSKERMNAAMPLRLLLVICGMVIGLFFLRLLNRSFLELAASYKTKLVTNYAKNLLWWVGWRGLILLIGYVVCVYALAQLFVLLINPVYTFPEWIPAILVEPKDIQNAFWNVWQKPATAAAWRTPELLRLQFFRELIAWSCGACALILGSIWGRLTKR